MTDSPRRYASTAADLAVDLLAILAAVALYRGLVVPGLEAVLGLSPFAASALRRAGVFLVALGAYVAANRWYERRDTPELRVRPWTTLLAAAVGAGSISITTGALFALGAVRVGAVRGWEPGLLGVGVVILVAAFLEELVFRAVLFRVVEKRFGLVAGLVVQAVAFGLLHVGNVEGGADAVATAVSVTLLGAMWALVFALSRNLWVVTAHHAAWNFAIVLTGVPLSGTEDWRALAPLASEAVGPGWLTGGAFGPENSVICLAVVSAVAVGLWRRVRSVSGDP